MARAARLAKRVFFMGGYEGGRDLERGGFNAVADSGHGGFVGVNGAPISAICARARLVFREAKRQSAGIGAESLVESNAGLIEHGKQSGKLWGVRREVRSGEGDGAVVHCALKLSLGPSSDKLN